MKNINKINFIADFLRYNELSTVPNSTIKSTRWLKHVLDFPINAVTNLTCNELWHDNGLNSYDFYSALKVEPSFAGWASVIYNRTNIQFDQLVKKSFSNSLVIGCELPDILRQSLTNNGITYLDTVASPIRFSEDIINCWRSNNSIVQKNIAKYQMPSSLHQYSANMIKAKYVWAKNEQLNEDTAIIMGQVNDDKSLINKSTGKTVTLSDFKDNINQIIDKYPTVLFKPHPYGTIDPFIKSLIAKKHLSLTNSNYYSLLCAKNIKHVYAINSGSIKEAEYFNVMSTAFMPPLYNIASNQEEAQLIDTPVEISNEWIKPQFWSDILSSLINVNSNLPDMSGICFRNTIRRSLNADWNFSEIDKVKI